MADPKPSPSSSFSLPQRRAAEPHLVDVTRLLRSLRERWFGTAVVTLLACGIVGFVLLRQPPVYAASTTLLIERSTDRVVDIKQVVDTTVESSLTDALLLTHIQQIRTHSFLSQVASSLTPAERARVKAPYAPVASAQKKAGIAAADGDAVTIEDIVRNGLKIERAGRTLLITVSMRHENPEIAQLISNRVADQYIVHLLDRSSASNDSALSFLSRQVEELRVKLEAADKKAQSYREQHNLVFIDQNQNIGGDRLRALSTSATQARVARLALDARLSQVETILKNTGDARQLSSAPEFAGYAQVQKQSDELRAKRDMLAERYARLHPLMIENASSLETLDRLARQQIEAALADLRNQRDKAAVEETQLRAELATSEKESLAREQLAGAYSVLRREVDTTRETYSQILGRLNETTISSRLQNTNVKVVGRAALPVKPVEPNHLKIVAILGMLGAGIIVAYPWALQARDKRIRGASDVEEFLGGTLLGELPLVKKVPKGQRGQIVSLATDQNMVEAFRSIYSQFKLSSQRTDPKCVLVTSTIPGEGKSFVACNLAASFAAHGKRTLLIDADLRRPTLHEAFGLDNHHGILRWLDMHVSANAAVLKRDALGITEVSPGLSLLRAGGVSSRVTEFIHSGPLQDLIGALRRDFDIIIIDSSPAGVFPDAEAFSATADELVYVCRFQGPDREHARQTLARLSRTDIALRGIILNAIPAGHAAAYYMSSYGHGAGEYRKGYAPAVG